MDGNGERGPAAKLSAKDIEEIVAHVWREVLEQPEVGHQENFFELGGHSLLAIQIMIRLEEELSKEELAVQLLFDAPTVAELAAALGRE